jgi:hypothetical protein
MDMRETPTRALSVRSVAAIAIPGNIMIAAKNILDFIFIPAYIIIYNFIKLMPCVQADKKPLIFGRAWNIIA